MNVAVVGTGTDVGKTFVTAGLTAWLRDEGIEARAVKPCQTGSPQDDDAGFVADVCGDEDAAVCLKRLEPPLAPTVAAEQTGEELDYEAIRDGCARELDRAEVGLVEGIGGLRVPLAGEREVIDLVSDLLIDEIVLVAGSGLGTLNYSSLSVEALERRGIAVDSIVLNEYEGATVAERTNPDVLTEMTGVPVYTLPPVDASPACVGSAVSERLSRDVCTALPDAER
jgi:dethiobiotin synthetase